MPRVRRAPTKPRLKPARLKSRILKPTRIDPPPEVPQTIAGLSIWLDATKITGLSDGAAVPQWDDASGNGNHGVQATGTNQPSYQTGEINSLPVVRFDGTTDWLGFTTPGALALTNGASGITLFAVLRPVTFAATRNIVFISTNGNAGTARVSFALGRTAARASIAGRRLDADGSAVIVGGATNLTASAPVMLTSVIDWANADAFIYVDQTLDGSNLSFQTAGTTTALDPLAFRVGANGVNAEFLDADLGELLVYSGAMAPLDRQAIWDYLADKWGLGAPGGPQVIPVTEATETETAQPVGKAKAAAVAEATETETAQLITPRKSRAITPATETETAQALAKAKVTAVAPATEAETAQAVARVKSRVVGPAVEVEAAQGIVVAGGQITPAIETETAQPIAVRKSRAVGQAAEAEQAQPISVRKSRAVGQASETETAQALAKAKVKAVAQAAETETAQAIARRKTITVGHAAEVEAAQAIQPLGAKIIPVGPAVEVETAQPIAKSKRRAVTQATEIETVQAVAKRRAYAVGPALELEEAQVITPTGGAAAPRWIEHTTTSSSHTEGATTSSGQVEGVLVGAGIVESSGGI